MFYIYLYEGADARGADLKGEAGELLVREAAAFWCGQQGIPLTDASMVQILRTEKGKPYFPDLPLEFSVSHTGPMWICIMGAGPCGIDIQEVRDCEYKKIAGKYFTRQEQSLVLKQGIAGFYRIWTRREAFAKYTGAGLFGQPLPSFVDGDGELALWVQWQDRRVYVRELELDAEIACAYVNEEETDEIQIFG